MQYASHAYRNALTGAGIVASMSRKADCYDNAPMESFEDRTRSSSQLQTRVTQHDLAAKLRKTQSSIANESGERRADFIEFMAICRAIRIDPVKLIGTLAA